MKSDHIPIIAIIGAGFCGTMTVVNLVNKAHYPLKIALIEKTSYYGTGIAYGTLNPHHRLNVYAIKMGAFADNPEHFFQWAKEHEAFWRQVDPSFETMPLSQHVFMPRVVYALYLKSLLNKAMQDALEKNVDISTYTKEATHLEKTPNNQLKITLNEGTTLFADVAVLAVGLPPSKMFEINGSSLDQYIHNIWSPKPSSFWQMNSFTSLPATSTIAVIGSGLTMIDAVLTLIDGGYQGTIVSLSKHGEIPEKHRDIIKTYPPFLNLENPPQTALQLLKIIRQEVTKGHAKGYDWRSVIDALRPITPGLWAALPLKEKKKVMRFLFNLWNRHRHRTAPECVKPIEHVKSLGQFKLIAGKVQKIEEDHQKFAIKYHTTGSTHSHIMHADYLINCSGSEMNLQKNDNPLVQSLLKNGYILPDSLNLGIQATSLGEVQGKAKGKLFAVGQILFGERFETIAVPELRTQCDQMAVHLLSSLDPLSSR